MTTEQLTPVTQEARKVLAEIVDECQQTAAWCTSQAAKALGLLQDEWISACTNADPNVPASFRGQCEDLLDNCSVLRLSIVERAENTADAARSRLAAISKPLGEDDDTRDLARHVLDGWNETIQPNVVQLFQGVEKLEESVRETLDAVAQEVLR